MHFHYQKYLKKKETNSAYYRICGDIIPIFTSTSGIFGIILNINIILHGMRLENYIIINYPYISFTMHHETRSFSNQHEKDTYIMKIRSKI
jgi:hypothetical protein